MQNKNIPWGEYGYFLELHIALGRRGEDSDQNSVILEQQTYARRLLGVPRTFGRYCRVRNVRV